MESVLGRIKMSLCQRRPSRGKKCSSILPEGSKNAVLPIPEVKAKILAAHRAGIKSVVLPDRNRGDLEDVPSAVLESLEIHFIRRVEEALPLCLESSGQPRSRPSSTPAPAFPPA